MDFSLKAVFGMDATGVKTEIKQLRRELGSFIEDYAKLGAGAAVAAFAALSKGAMDLAGRLADTSQNIGINIVSLQALEAQHGRNGVKEAELQKALEKTKAAVIDAANGNEKARASLNALGLSADKLIKLPLDKQYEAIARASFKAKNETQAYSALCDLFGDKIGPKFFGSLKELGEVGLPGVTRAARESGHVMEKETIVALDRASDAIDDFKRRATVAVGNILINFRSEEGLKLLGLQLLKAVGTFGAGIVDAVTEGAKMGGAAMQGAFRYVANFLGDEIVQKLVAVAAKLPVIFGVSLEKVMGADNIAKIAAQFSASGKGLVDSISDAIARTSPSTFKNEVGEFWDKRIADQQKVVDALNKRDFGEDAKKIEAAGLKVAKKFEDAGKKIEEGGAAAAGAIESAAGKLGGIVGDLKLAITRTGASYDAQSTVALEGVRSRLRSQVTAMEQDTSFASVFSPNAKNPLLHGLKAELYAVEKELAQRAAVATYAARFGEQAARYQYGDAVVNRALQNMGESSTRTATAVENINRRLNTLLG